MTELYHELDHELREVEFFDDDWSWLYDYVNNGMDLWETAHDCN